MKAALAMVAALAGAVSCSSSDTSHAEDLAMPEVAADMAAGAPDLTTCTPSTSQCAGDTLVVCGADGGVPATTACPFGCTDVGGAARCQSLVPTQPVSANDVAFAGLSPVTLTTTVIFDTTTGAITDGSGATIRDANTSVSPGALAEVHQGIAFHTLETSFVIWTFGGLDVAAGATVLFKGGARVAIASQSSLSIRGLVDARGYDFSGATPALCSGSVGGPGGGIGGAATMAGGPAGAGGAGSASGGGGGGDGDVGGSGGGATMGGAVRGTQALAGGIVFSGAGGGGPSGVGGGGGGGLQLVALGPVVIDGTGAARGGINLGGCGGKASGGGGGAGGELLVEAATIELRANGGIAANGGGGGGTSGDGQPGALSTTAAAGGTGGGTGGVSGSLAGANSSTAGGGGGSGRIRFSTRSGMAVIDAAAVLSPALTDRNSLQDPTATVGMATLQ